MGTDDQQTAGRDDGRRNLGGKQVLVRAVLLVLPPTFGLGKEKAKKRFRPSQDLRGMKVLVVDDNATSRGIFQEMLESFSFKVTLTASGQEGINGAGKSQSR